MKFKLRKKNALDVDRNNKMFFFQKIKKKNTDASFYFHLYTKIFSSLN